jgi:hypothetical protein
MVKVSMNIFVTKVDGSKQLFNREKVVRTCLKMGADKQIAEEIANMIEERLYNGIPTNKILEMMFQLLRKHQPEIQHLHDLRKGLSLMNSRPEFERFIQILLYENGFEVTPNQIIRGKCVEHEVDAIVSRDDTTYYVEAKHHFNYHTPTGLDESRIARAVLEDVNDGYKLGLNNSKIDNAMIITNTRFSKHAKRYGQCREILQIGWSSPPNRGLQDLIEEKQLHPISCLTYLKKTTREKLVSEGIILIKQLVKRNPEKMARKIGLSKKTIKNIVENAKDCASILYHNKQSK